jgi:hypothetical protein
MARVVESVTVPVSQILNRVFQIKSGNNFGSATAIEIGERQYLVTAAHGAEEASMTSTLQVFHDKQWKNAKVTVVAFDTAVDVAIFALPFRLVAEVDVPFDVGNILMGQHVGFLGYPLQLRGPGTINKGFPEPVIGHGVLSFFNTDQYPHNFFVAGIAPPGFSGGPIFFYDHVTQTNKIGGIIIASMGYSVDVTDTAGKVIGRTMADSGIIQCINPKSIKEFVKKNPIGFELKPGKKSG